MKQHIKEIIVVEGKNDTNTLQSFFDCDTIETGGDQVNEKTIDHVRVKSRIIDEQRNNFYFNADCNEDEINTIKDKIIVEVNHDIFSLPSN